MTPISPSTSWIDFSSEELERFRNALETTDPNPQYRTTEHLEWLRSGTPHGRPVASTRWNATSDRFTSLTIIPRNKRAQRVSGELTHLLWEDSASVEAALQQLDLLAGDAPFESIYCLASRNQKSLLDTAPNWRPLKHFRTRIAFPRPRSGRSHRSVRVTAAFLESEECSKLLSTLLDPETGDVLSTEQVATTRWRLSAPNGRYVITWNAKVAAVSIRRAGTIPMALVLKSWARVSQRPKRRVSAMPAFGALCRFHGTPLVAYRGRNPHTRMLGLPIARLNPLSHQYLYLWQPDQGVELDVDDSWKRNFELLDSDAY